MEYWQIASGSLGRYYAKDFIRFGMAFVGGAEHASRMAEVKVGDRILLDQEHDQPLSVLVNGKLKFRGVQGAYKGKIAVQISEVIA